MSRVIQTSDFYPRPPRGGRLRMLLNSALISLFLSTPSARRAMGAAQCEEVSGCISIHALREEGDCSGLTKQSTSKPFLSTPSARRATRTGIRLPRSMGNFYPRPPRGGRPDTNDSRLGPEHFYPRPPRGGRHKHLERRLRASKFLSTPSARRATCAACASICRRGNFYPRPPRGGRPD